MRQKLNNGFTLVELVLVIFIGGLLFSVLFTPLDELYSSNSRSLGTVLNTGAVRNTLRTIESEVATAISFHNTNTPVTDTTGSNNNPSSPTQWAWTGISGDGTSNRVLITSNYATTIIPTVDTNGTRTLVYAVDCQTPLVNNVIYFVRNSSLYRRTLTNTASRCSGYNIGQRHSCAGGVSHASCLSVDAKLLDNVTSFTVDYYQNPTSTSTIANQYVTSSVPASAQTIRITVTAGSGSTAQTSAIRITRVNGTTL